MMTIHEKFMKEAIAQAFSGMNNNEGGPFGAIIVKDGEIVGRGNNRVTSSNDPTAHAEMVAIRDACKNLGSFTLEGCVIYTSCEPCPMCLGAVYWSRLDALYYGCTKADAAKIDFDDQFIYEEISRPLAMRKIPFTKFMRHEALEVFNAWANKNDRTPY